MRTITDESRSDLHKSIIAQLIECALMARYKNDFDGLNLARWKVREELIARNWTLPPYTYIND